MRSIAVTNEKGGVGKTVTTVHLAGAIAELGLRTLACDVDSSGDLSATFLLDVSKLPLTADDIFAGTDVPVVDIIRPTSHPNLWVLPADERLKQHDKISGYHHDPSVHLLSDALSQLADRFDVVLFDCPPRDHLTTFAAMLAAQDVIVPIVPSLHAIRGALRINQAIRNIQLTHNPRLRVKYVLSLVEPRSATQKACREMIVNTVQGELYETIIPKHSTYDSAINVGKPVTMHSRRSKAAEIMRQFAKEVLEAHNEHDAHAERAA